MKKLSPHDRAYYEARAEAELNLARRSADSCALKIHYNLASRYFSILDDGADQPPAFATLDHTLRHEIRAKVGKAKISR